MKKKNFLPLSVILGITVLVAGCGQTDPQPTVQTPAPTVTAAPVASTNTVTCTAGQFRIGPHCVMASSFTDACTQIYGRLITISGRQLCRMDLFGNAAPWRLPILNPSDPSGPYAHVPGISVQPGDKLSFSGSGGWGGAVEDVETYLGFLDVHTTTLNCTLVSMKGISNGETLYNDDLPQGFIASDGVESYFLGSSSSHTIKNSGTLKLGFNLPPDTSSWACYRLNITLKVTHCEDATGTTYPCQ